MTSLEYKILFALGRGRLLAESLYKICDADPSHVRRILRKFVEDNLVEVTGEVKTEPGEAGRPMKEYGILDMGEKLAEAYKREINE